MTKQRTKKPEGARDAVLEVVRQAREGEQPIEVTLLTGAKATLHPVSPALIQDIQVSIQNPPVPIFHNEEKGRDEENPSDPAYLAALERAEVERTQAVMDAQIMMGVELEPGYEVPPNWVKRLKRLGLEFDEGDPDEVEFTFKKYGVSNSHLIVLGKLSGISEEDIERFRDLFRG
jgi:hypothetical protein